MDKESQWSEINKDVADIAKKVGSFVVLRIRYFPPHEHDLQLD